MLSTSTTRKRWRRCKRRHRQEGQEGEREVFPRVAQGRAPVVLHGQAINRHAVQRLLRRLPRAAQRHNVDRVAGARERLGIAPDVAIGVVVVADDADGRSGLACHASSPI